MEPRARAGKNVGKVNFTHNELAQLLFSHGDVKQPLPDTVRVLDEIATDFIQGLGLEAVRTAHYAGRQKVKYEDFEFTLRKAPLLVGKIQETFEKSKEIKEARKAINLNEDAVMNDFPDEKASNTKARGGKQQEEEELGEADDDADAEADALGSKKR